MSKMNRIDEIDLEIARLRQDWILARISAELEQYAARQKARAQELSAQNGRPVFFNLIAADKELVTPRVERLRAIRRRREKQIDEKVDLLVQEQLEYFDA